MLTADIAVAGFAVVAAAAGAVSAVAVVALAAAAAVAAGVGHACSHPSQNPNSKAFVLQPMASARPFVGVLTRSYATTQ